MEVSPSIFGKAKPKGKQLPLPVPRKGNEGNITSQAQRSQLSGEDNIIGSIYLIQDQKSTSKDQGKKSPKHTNMTKMVGRVNAADMTRMVRKVKILNAAKMTRMVRKVKVGNMTRKVTKVKVILARK